MRILLLSDGIAGHYRQSEGIVAALGRQHAVKVQCLTLGPVSLVPNRLVPRLARLLPAWLYLKFQGIDLKDIEPADLIVSAGAKTLGSNVILAKKLNVPNIFSGSSRGFAPDHITLTLLPYPSAAHKPGHLYTLKPSPIDPIQTPQPEWKDITSQTFSLLVGGPTRYVRFKCADWAALAAWAEDIARRYNICWNIVTSRRTPPEAYKYLERLAGTVANVQITDFRKCGPGSITNAFDNTILCVTGDSLSMISEAVAAQRRTVVIMPSHTTPFRDNEAIDALENEHLITRLSTAALAQTDIGAVLNKIIPRQHNHLDELALKIGARLTLWNGEKALR